MIPDCISVDFLEQNPIGLSARAVVFSINPRLA